MAKELLKCSRPPRCVVRSRTRDTAPDTPVQVVGERATPSQSATVVKTRRESDMQPCA